MGSTRGEEQVCTHGLCRIQKCLQESCTVDCWFFLSWMFLPPWYMSTFSLHCNCFSGIKQFPEGNAGFWQSHCASASHARCLVWPFQRNEARKRGPYLRILPCDTHWSLSSFFQTNIPWKQPVRLPSTHPNTISTVLALFKRIHSNALKVFKMWQIGW